MSLFNQKPGKPESPNYASDMAFSKAVSKAFALELKDLLLRRSKRLLPFEEVRERLELWYGSELGIRTVPIESIIGSQGRYRNFTRHFLPLDESLRNRWRRIEDAVTAGKDLPPVELYKVCNAYFVKDGHHRISVAKAKNRSFIEALVFEYACDLSLDDKTDLEKLAILETRGRFLKETGLKKPRTPDLHLTVLGGYPILMEHVQRHRYFLAEKEKREVGIKEAAASWFDHIYQPMVDLIRENGIMKQFPHRTETDFYIWVSKYKNRLFQDVFQPEEARLAVDNYSRIFSNPLRRFLGKLRKYLGIVRF